MPEEDDQDEQPQEMGEIGEKWVCGAMNDIYIYIYMIS